MSETRRFNNPAQARQRAVWGITPAVHLRVSPFRENALALSGTSDINHVIKFLGFRRLRRNGATRIQKKETRKFRVSFGVWVTTTD